MRIFLMNLIAGLATLLAFSSLASHAASQSGAAGPKVADWGGQASDPKGAPLERSTGNSNAVAPATPFEVHDLSGVWRLAGPVVPRVPSLSNDVPPMTAWGQARFDENKPSFGPRSVPPALGNDPIGNCNPLGLPRIHFFSWPLEIIQTPDKMIQVFEWTRVYREIWTDGRSLPTDWDPRWYGYSVGRWEGDTFIVDSVGFDDRTWIDHFGRPHSDQMRLQERYRRTDHETLELTMTLDDPKAYTKLWVSDKKVLKPLPQQGWPYKELREEICAPANEESFNQKLRNPAGGLTNR